MASKNERVEAQSFVPVLLSPLGLFSRRKRLEEINYHYNELYGIEVSYPEYPKILWSQIVAEKATITEDIFFAVLPELNFDQKTQSELFSLLKKNNRLRLAILAELGDINAARFTSKNKITIENPMPAGVPAASIIAMGMTFLRRQLANAQPNDLKKCKLFIHRLVREIDPAKIDDEWAMTLATNLELWRLVTDSKRWFERKKHFLARLKINEIFTRRLQFGNDAAITAAMLRAVPVVVQPATPPKLDTMQQVADALTAASSRQDSPAVKSKLINTVSVTNTGFVPIDEKPILPKPKEENTAIAVRPALNSAAVLTALQLPLGSLENQENIRPSGKMAEVALVLDVSFDRFREKHRSSKSPILSPLSTAAQSLTATELKLSQENLSKLDKADCAEVIRGTYYSDLFAVSKNSLNVELCANELRAKGYSAEEIEVLASLYAGLNNKGFSFQEAERILRLVLQSQGGASLFLGNGLVKVAHNFVDVEQLNLDKIECGEKLLRVWKNGSTAVIHLEAEIVGRNENGTMSLFKYELHLSDDGQRITVEKSRIYITDQTIAAQARAKLDEEGFVSHRRLGMERFELTSEMRGHDVTRALRV